MWRTHSGERTKAAGTKIRLEIIGQKILAHLSRADEDNVPGGAPLHRRDDAARGSEGVKRALSRRFGLAVPLAVL
ncbi:MAG: hypothetical protein WCC90_00335 [Methylocella sp.]